MTKEEVVQLYNRYIEVKKKNNWQAHSKNDLMEPVKINANLNPSDVKELNDIVKKLLSDSNLKFLSREQLITIFDDDNFRTVVWDILKNFQDDEK